MKAKTLNLKTRINRLSLALAAAGLMAVSLPSLANEHGKSGPEHMAERLELSAEQRAQVSLLMQAHREQMQSLRESGDFDRSQAREGRQALSEEIRALLNEEQAAKFDAMKERRGKRGSHRGQRHGGFHDLDLSDAQRAALRELMQARREAGRDGDRDAFRAQLREILTEEQLAELEARRSEKPRRGQRERHHSRDG